MPAARMLAAWLALAALAHCGAEPSAHLAASFELKNVAVAAIAESFPGSPGPALLATTFAAFGKTPTYFVRDLASILKGQAASVETLEDATVWTNYIGMAPKQIGPAVVATAGGFLVPGKQTGSIDLFDVLSRPSIRRHTYVHTCLRACPCTCHAMSTYKQPAAKSRPTRRAGFTTRSFGTI